MLASGKLPSLQELKASPKPPDTANHYMQSRLSEEDTSKMNSQWVEVAMAATVPRTCHCPSSAFRGTKWSWVMVWKERDRKLKPRRALMSERSRRR